MFWPPDNGKISFGGLKTAVPTHSDATSTAVLTGDTATARNGSGDPGAISQSNDTSGDN